jgi:enoyl-CoA hydratase/carnithine racemase
MTRRAFLVDNFAPIPIAVLTLDDPKRANAMGPEMGDAFKNHVQSIQNDPTVQVVIVRGILDWTGSPRF